MILSRREIRVAIRDGRIGLTPCPPDDDLRWSPISLDLTLDGEIRPWLSLETAGAEVVIDPMSQKFNANRLIAQLTQPLDCTTGFILDPGAFVLGWTIEKLRLPYTSRLAARVEGRSSLARFGTGVHVTAPTIHPGFGQSDNPAILGSPIRLEIWNIGRVRIRLTKGLPICQILFEEVHGTPDQGYQGQFAIQGPG